MDRRPKDLDELLKCVAVMIGATEVVAFSLDYDFVGKNLKPILHIRGEKVDDTRKKVALAAFEQIVGSCIDRATDDAIEIQGNGGPDGKLFCLVAIARQENKIVGAAAFIVRCRNQQEALAQLKNICRELSFF